MGQSSSKKPKITAQDRAILEVKVQRDRLKQYQKKLNVITGRETEIAKEHLKLGNRRLALLTLKKRNYQRALLDRTHEQLWNLEQMVQTIEFTQIETQVFNGLKTGNAILTQLQNEMKVEDVEKLMDDTAEAVAYQNEIAQLLAGAGGGVEVDESELLDELSSLIAEEEEVVPEEVLVHPEVVEEEELILPEVPKHTPIIRKTLGEKKLIAE